MKSLKLLFVALVTASVLPAMAQNTTVYPIVTNNADTSVSVACDGTNYLVGIQGDYADPEYYTTAQMFGPTGALIGSRISPVLGFTGGNPRVASSGSNFLMIMPEDYSGPSETHNIIGQIVSPLGALAGGYFDVTTPISQEQKNPALVYGGGEYLAVWNDYRSGTNWAVYGQLISASGALIGGNIPICEPVNGQDEEGASVAFDGTNFLVVWPFCSTSNHYVAYGVFISPVGTVGAPFAIGQTVSPTRSPNLETIFNGTNYLVVWCFDAGTGGAGNPAWSIYGRFVTPSSSFPGNEFPIVTNGHPIYLGLAFDGANYLLCWNVNFAATNSGVPFQFLNASGQPMGPQFMPFPAQGSEVPLLASTIYDGKRFVSVATLSAGGMSPTTSTNSAGIYTNNAGVYGVFIPASTTPPQFGPGTFYGNKQFLLSLVGTPGINYAIQAGTNLAISNWTAIITNSPTNGTFSFTDAGATNQNRFYRAIKQ
jgi:hypothetical protein